MWIIYLYFLEEELEINPISNNESLLLESKELFQAQGEWELLSIDISDYTTNLLWNSQDLLIYQVQSKGYGV